MVRNLIVSSVLAIALTSCMGPKKGPSPVTDGGFDGNTLPAAGLTPVVTPTTTTTTPAPVATNNTTPAPAPAKKKKSTGNLPISNPGNK
jgi:hypothetical protein